MRIEAYSQMQQLYDTKKAVQVRSNASVKASDKLQISSAGKDIQSAKAALANVPDVREDLIASVKARIDNGTYQVSAESFAEKLMQKYGEMR